MLRIVTLLIIATMLSSCNSNQTANSDSMNQIAESYVELVLKVGVWDQGYVDAYYGPEVWRPDTMMFNKSDEFPSEMLKSEAEKLVAQIGKVNQQSLGNLEKLRRNSLEKQLISVVAIIDMMSGVKLTFDEESKLLYDAVVPPIDTSRFDEVLQQINAALSGEGDLQTRMGEFNKQFEIPEDKLAALIDTAISESRKRTLEHIELPPDESFKTEYVKNQPWSAYNWYKGNNISLIQFNTDFPKRISSPVGTGAHEGYPGHHVYGVLLEQRMMKENGWVEFSIFPIYGPQGLIAEGSANYGIDVAFPGNEREIFEREVLFPMAGIDTSLADIYYEIRDLRKGFKFFGTFAAREYLDGRKTKEETTLWLMKYGLVSRKRAEQRISFFDKYRSYVINYTLGMQMVKQYMIKNGGTDDNPERRWELFYDLISTPHTPSDLL